MKNKAFEKEVEDASKYLEAKTGERQIATKLEDIRRDHVARYEWINSQVEAKSSITDACCGVGYGSNILAKGGHTVTGIDIRMEAILYARKHWNHSRVTFSKGDLSLSASGQLKKSDVAVAFECIEHIKDPRPMLKALRKTAKSLFASVPNEAVLPWMKSEDGYVVTTAHHYRHYTKGQFSALLGECGWFVVEWFGQAGRESEVGSCAEQTDRTLIAKCEAAEAIAPPIFDPVTKPTNVPDHVAIIGLGHSMAEYTKIAKGLGGRHKYCDETWAINALGSIIQCDKIFHMDDVRIQEIRAKALPESNTAVMLEWMKTTEIPVMTSRPHKDYPATVAFPLAEVLTEFDSGYFNSTVAYAVAYAIWIGVKKISLFGVDFTYPDAHQAEKGRACVEYWLGMAAARGIRVVVPKASTLLDALHTQAERFYGYDTLELTITQKEGKINIKFIERGELPTAEQIEENYNHDKHPNALMSEVETDDV